MEKLPVEILVFIFRYLNWRELFLTIDRVCWHWNEGERALVNLKIDFQDDLSLGTVLNIHSISHFDGIGTSRSSLPTIKRLASVVRLRPDVLQRCKSLRLPFHNDPYDQEAREILSVAAETLKELRLTRCSSLGDKTVENVVKLCTNLEILDLKAVRISDSAVDLLSRLPRLKEVNLKHCLWISNQNTLRRSAEQPLSSLRSLLLPRFVSNTFVRSLRYDSPSLETLYLANCPYIIGKSVKNLPTNLTHLNLNRTELFPPSYIRAVAQLPGLKQLHLCCLGQVKDTAALLADPGFPVLLRLQHLSIEGLPTFSTVVQQIAIKTPNITSLCLRGHAFDSIQIGATQFAQQLKVLQIRWIPHRDAVHDSFDTRGLEQLAGLRVFALKATRMTKLEPLCALSLAQMLSKCQDVSIECEASDIHEFLSPLRAVRILRIHCSNLAPDLDKIFLQDGNCESLELLRLSGPAHWHISEAVLSKLRNRNPHLQIVIARSSISQSSLRDNAVVIDLN